MIQLELERRLETGLSELGVELGPRIYRLETETKARIHDISREITTDDLRDLYKQKNKRRATTATLYEIIGKVTESQIDVAFGFSPFFYRVGEEYGGVRVGYSVMELDGEMGRSEYDSDTILSQPATLGEIIDISPTEGPQRGSLATIETNSDGKNTMSVSVDANFVATMNEPSQLANRLKLLQKLDGKKYNPIEVYNAIMRVLQYQPRIDQLQASGLN